MAPGMLTETGKALVTVTAEKYGIEELFWEPDILDEKLADFKEKKRQVSSPMTRNLRLELHRHIHMPASFVTGICSLSSKHLIAVSYYTKKMTLIDKLTGETIPAIEMNAPPWDVTVVSENKMAVTLPHEGMIQYISISGSDTMKEEERIKVRDDCRGIEYYNDTLIVTFIFPGSVQVLDMNGTCLRTFTTDGRGHRLFMWSRYIALSPDHGTVYVSDSESHTVTALTMSGQVKTALTMSGQVKSVVRDERYLPYPQGVTVDTNGNVYVCDAVSDTVNLVCTDTGTVTPLLTYKDGIQHPDCIKYCDKDNKLYVGMPQGIRVYDVI